MPTELRIRPTTTSDREAVLALVGAAFSGPHRDGSEELAVVRDTWALDAGVAFDLVAELDDRIVGHILGGWGDLDGVPVVGIAPLAVLPELHRQGIGSALVHDLIGRAEQDRLPLLVLLGSPAYYGRFGFEPSGPCDIIYAPAGADNPHFQVRRLSADDPALHGTYRYCWEAAPENP